jgi:hypothetical protein
VVVDFALDAPLPQKYVKRNHLLFS